MLLPTVFHVDINPNPNMKIPLAKITQKHTSLSKISVVNNYHKTIQSTADNIFRPVFYFQKHNQLFQKNTQGFLFQNYPMLELKVT